TRWSTALDLFADISQPSMSCFGAAAAACELGLAWESALTLLTRLAPLRPDQALLNAILGACGKGNQWALSHCLLRQSWTVDPVGLGAALE
ncbi:MPK2, partial [Symbiodinium pilosum]